MTSRSNAKQDFVACKNIYDLLARTVKGLYLLLN